MVIRSIVLLVFCALFCNISIANESELVNKAVQKDQNAYGITIDNPKPVAKKPYPIPGKKHRLNFNAKEPINYPKKKIGSKAAPRHGVTIVGTSKKKILGVGSKD